MVNPKDTAHYSNVVGSRYAVSYTHLFLRFQAQDEHNASFFSNMSWKELPQDNYKITKKPRCV